jgi:hypothetical protein
VSVLRGKTDHMVRMLLSFKNPTGFEHAKEVFDSIGGVVPPENQAKVKDFKQMARYLCHLDQPNKHRYQLEDVRVYLSIMLYHKAPIFI